MSATPDRILRDLAELWVTLGKEGQPETSAGVLRACTMTLVVLAEESEDMGAISETLAALMPEHPARTILVRLSGAGERALDARVYAQCWMPFGQRRQICCEQIEITASDGALGDLPAVLLPLAAADLPLIVWCRSRRLTTMPEFTEIAQIAQKLILDSANLSVTEALPPIADRVGREPIVADLAWTRLTRWREMLAQVFENRANLARLPGIRNVKVTYAAGLETAAWYLGAWAAESPALTRGRVQMDIASDPAGPSLRLTLTGEGMQVVLERQQERLVATVNEAANCTHLPEPSDYLLLREELGIVRRDTVFERTLVSAAGLAYPVEK